MNLDITVESLAKRYRPDTQEWDDSVKLVAKRFTRGQLTKKRDELDLVVRDMADLIKEAGATDQKVKSAFDTAYRQLELVVAARRIHFQPLGKRWL
jgi:hypothetical protein